MAAGTQKSTAILNEEALPQVLNRAGVQGGRERVRMGSFEVPTTSTDDIGDIILLDKLPTNAVITGLYFMCDDLDSGGTALDVNVGIYDTDQATAKDADAFASEWNGLSGALAVWTDVLAEAGAGPLAKIGNELWDWAGDTEEPTPGVEYYIGLTVSAAATTSAAGTLAYKITYVLD